MIPTTIVDNFFETPELVRDFALSCNFEKTGENYPGVRTRFINDLNTEIFNLFTRKIYNIFFSDPDMIDIFCDSHFQLIDSKYEKGWFHKDNLSKWHIAGVVYLNPHAPLNGGTIIGEQTKNFNSLDYNHRNEFYANKTVDLNNYRNIRDQHNECFKETIVVNNIFNRALIYDASKFHRENTFFGNDKKDSRLTLVFFIKFRIENSFPPIIRSKI